MITVKRKTTESEITVTLDAGAPAADYREKINTPYTFLNHMIEMIVHRAGVNIGVEVKLAKFQLSHVVCEDAGQALGKAAAEFIARRRSAYAFGDGFGMIDEARAFAAFSFESRSLLQFTKLAEIPAQVEGMDSDDVKTFIEGFVIGAGCTLHIELLSGENGHHIWEAVFRAIGVAFGKVIAENKLRENLTSGVAGRIEWSVE